MSAVSIDLFTVLWYYVSTTENFWSSHIIALHTKGVVIMAIKLTDRQAEAIASAIGRALRADISTFYERARRVLDLTVEAGLYVPESFCIAIHGKDRKDIIEALRGAEKSFRRWVNPPLRLSNAQAPAWLMRARAAA